MNVLLKSLNKSFCILFLFFFCFLSLVFAQSDDPNSFVFSEEKLGFIENSGANPAAVGLNKYGLATHVSLNWSFDDVATKGNNVIFSNQNPEIIWFGLFNFREKSSSGKYFSRHLYQ